MYEQPCALVVMVVLGGSSENWITQTLELVLEFVVEIEFLLVGDKGVTKFNERVKSFVFLAFYEAVQEDRRHVRLLH